MKKVMLLLLVVLCSVNAFSDRAYSDANMLLKQCEEDSPYSKGFCMGYIAGVVDASESETLAGYRYCKPSWIFLKELLEITTKYLNNNPEGPHLPAFGFVQNALYEAFPCE